MAGELVKRRQPRRRRQAPAFLAVAGVVLAGCGLTKVADPTSSATIDRSYRPPAAPAQVQAAFCLDGTLSIDRAAVSQVLSVVASSVSQWVNSAGSPALDLQVRKVDGTSCCDLSRGDGTVPGLFGQRDCSNCDGSKWVCKAGGDRRFWR